MTSQLPEKLPLLHAVRYVTPLREGGSLPAVVEANDGDLYVMKFVGAGQGPKALVAEIIGGEIARALGLAVPELVLLEMDGAMARTEPNEEIRDLLRASVGLNLGMRYLSGALPFNPLLIPSPDSVLASQIVWLDAFITNVDRTARNVNLLLWDEEMWLIDHGAALYFHHDWTDYLARSRSPFAMIRQHSLLPFASALETVDAAFRTRLTAADLSRIVNLVPDQWLGGEELFEDVAGHRRGYVDYLNSRLDAADIFVQEARNAYQERR